MKRILYTTIILAVGFCNLSLLAQDRDYRDDDRYHRDHRDQSWWSNRLFERVRADLDHIQSATKIFSTDQFRLARTRQELSELQTNATNGRADEKDVDDVINALQRVVADNRLADRDRDMLNEDLNKLRDYREHHDRYYPRRG